MFVAKTKKKFLVSLKKSLLTIMLEGCATLCGTFFTLFHKISVLATNIYIHLTDFTLKYLFS